MTNPTSYVVTDSDIDSLHSEASYAGDPPMAAICDIALGRHIMGDIPEWLARENWSQARARAYCERIILDSRARANEE